MGGTTDRNYKTPFGTTPESMEISRLRAEVGWLTDILIACCNAAGGQAVKGVSVGFLARVPAEIAGRIERLTKDRDHLREQLAAANEKLELATLALGYRGPEIITETRSK